MASNSECCSIQIKSFFRTQAPTQCCFAKCIRYGEQQDFCSKHFVPPLEHRCVCTTGNSAQRRCKHETIGVQFTGNNRHATEIRVCSLHFNMHSDFGKLGVIHPEVEDRETVFEELNRIRTAVLSDQMRLITRDRLGHLTVFQGRHPLAPRPQPPPRQSPNPFSFGSSSDPVECSVCYDSFHSNRCIVLPCNHSFCALCTVRIANRVCPLCRAPF